MLNDPTPKRRWRRAQRFELSEQGADAEARYRACIVAAREEGGRASFDAARLQWAAAQGLQPDDGAYLAELRAQPQTVPDLVVALESSGKTPSDALAAVGRLYDAGLLTLTYSPPSERR